MQVTPDFYSSKMHQLFACQMKVFCFDIVGPAPGQISPVLTIGVRVNTPLYFAPPDSSALGAYPGLAFTFTDCYSRAPTVNITIDRMSVRR